MDTKFFKKIDLTQGETTLTFDMKFAEDAYMSGHRTHPAMVPAFLPEERKQILTAFSFDESATATDQQQLAEELDVWAIGGMSECITCALIEGIDEDHGTACEQELFADITWRAYDPMSDEEIDAVLAAHSDD